MENKFNNTLYRIRCSKYSKIEECKFGNAATVYLQDLIFKNAPISKHWPFVLTLAECKKKHIIFLLNSIGSCLFVHKYVRLEGLGMRTTTCCCFNFQAIILFIWVLNFIMLHFITHVLSTGKSLAWLLYVKRDTVKCSCLKFWWLSKKKKRKRKNRYSNKVHLVLQCVHTYS